MTREGACAGDSLSGVIIRATCPREGGERMIQWPLTESVIIRASG
jgi:hypothetical protein